MDRIVRGIALCFWLAAGSMAALAQSPFTVTPSLKTEDGVSRVDVAFRVPTNAFLYADHLSFELSGEADAPYFSLPRPESIHDKFSGEEKLVYGRSFEATCKLKSTGISNATLTVRFQGCDDANCYFPEEKVFTILADGTVKLEGEPQAVTTTVSNTEWRTLADRFVVRGRGSGYLSEKSFIAFLDRAESGSGGTEAYAAPQSGWGILATICLVVLGGIGLNLTPCILPMIPINLAIIGAGAQAGSRRRGFALGGTYAAGMAIAYGLLGVFVVLTGSKFGALNSSPWFNLVIALVFVVLALAMFDVFAIDLSRFQGRSVRPSQSARTKVALAYSMGTVAALLAGACVAPVVISVLVQATTLYNRGIVAGLFLPFLLGIGMGLPWPFAGAGLSFLPKPGVWMTRVKYAFGVLIALFALYYGALSVSLFRSTPVFAKGAAAGTSTKGPSCSRDDLTSLLVRAQSEAKPVFIDFWASWCKNCSAMEHTTFKSPDVRRRLGTYLPVRFQAEHPNEPETREVLDYFGVFGLPTYVVLQPKRPAPTEPQTIKSVSADSNRVTSDSEHHVLEPTQRP